MSRILKFAIFFVLIIISCNNDKEDFDEKRSNVIGEWKVTETKRQIRADTVAFEVITEFIIKFYSDGTGSREINSPVAEYSSFEWWYQYSPEYFIVEYEEVFLDASTAQEYRVILNEMDKQHWEWDYKPRLGVVDLYEYTWDMVRM